METEVERKATRLFAVPALAYVVRWSFPPVNTKRNFPLSAFNVGQPPAATASWSDPAPRLRASKSPGR